MFELKIEKQRPFTLVFLCNENPIAKYLFIESFTNNDELPNLKEMIDVLPSSKPGLHYQNMTFTNNSISFEYGDESPIIYVPTNTPGLKESLLKIYEEVLSA